VRKVSQTVQFVGAREGGMDEILAHFGLTIAISQNTSARDHGATAARARRQAGSAPAPKSKWRGVRRLLEECEESAALTANN